MEKEIIRRLIEDQLDVIKKIYSKIEERRDLSDPIVVESLAYQLHNLYSAFEDMFKIVAKYFENEIEDPSRYHVELLRRMKIEIPGIRPALISERSYELLNSLRSFRHFFRHAYSQELDPRRVGIVLEDAMKLKDLFGEDVERFLDHLEDS